MTWVRVILIVTGCALGGMILGGLIGLVSGLLTPNFFAHLLPWDDVGPIGFATFAGGMIGLICGKILGLIALLIQIICECRRRRIWWIQP